MISRLLRTPVVDGGLLYYRHIVRTGERCGIPKTVRKPSIMGLATV